MSTESRHTEVGGAYLYRFGQLPTMGQNSRREERGKLRQKKEVRLDHKLDKEFGLYLVFKRIVRD